LVEKGRVKRIKRREFEFTAGDIFGCFNESYAKREGRNGCKLIESFAKGPSI
jgi:hypothetical protein